MEWISVKDKLPKIGTTVIAVIHNIGIFKNNRLEEAYEIHEAYPYKGYRPRSKEAELHWSFFNHSGDIKRIPTFNHWEDDVGEFIAEITHWMPMPELPKKGE